MAHDEPSLGITDSLGKPVIQQSRDSQTKEKNQQIDKEDLLVYKTGHILARQSLPLVYFFLAINLSIILATWYSWGWRQYCDLNILLHLGSKSSVISFAYTNYHPASINPVRHLPVIDPTGRNPNTRLYRVLEKVNELVIRLDFPKNSRVYPVVSVAYLYKPD